MRRFKLEHKRQRKYKAALFMFIILLTSLVYFNYGRPTGFVVSDDVNGSNILLYNAMANEQIMLFLEYHPDYGITFRELDYLQLVIAKEGNPNLYSSLEGRHYEIEFFSGDAQIVAILNDRGNVVKVYNPDLE